MIISITGAKDLVQNNINSQSITQDYVLNATNEVKMCSAIYLPIKQTIFMWMNFTDIQIRNNQKNNIIHWIIDGAILFIVLVCIIVYFNWKYAWALKTFQYNN